MKSKTKALLVAPVLVISLTLALLIIPNSGTPSSGTQKTRLVLAAAGAAQWPYTHISTVRLRCPDYQVALFYGTGETVYAEVGDNISEVRVSVNISTDYAISTSEAMANTKVHVTISHPTQGTIYTGWLDAIEAALWAEFYNVSYSKTFSTHTLVLGTYTITTIYQVYA